MKNILRTLAIALITSLSLAGGASAATFLSSETGEDPFPGSIFGSESLAECATGINGDQLLTCDDWNDGNSAGSYVDAFELGYFRFVFSVFGGELVSYHIFWGFDPSRVTGVTDPLFPRYVTVNHVTGYQIWELDANETTEGFIDTGLDSISHVSFYDGNTSVIPLPAAGWMLLAGIGGLAALRRRKAA